MKRLLIDLFLALPHELSHYVTARALFVPARFGIRGVAVHVDARPWQHVAISIAPTIASLLVIVGALIWLILGLRPSLAVLLFSYGLMLLTTCVGDWRDIRQIAAEV